VYPADGFIDAFFAGERHTRMGFDVVGSPFGKLPGSTGLWSAGIEEFELSMFCDGWIYQKPLSEYEGVRVVKRWFTAANRAAAIAQLASPEPAVKHLARSVTSLTQGMASDTRPARRFGRFR
jgi:hypothetical protein